MILNIIKSLAVAISEILLLSANGFENLFEYFKTVYVGNDTGIWLKIFANLGVFTAVIVFFKEEISAYLKTAWELIVKLLKKEKAEKTDGEYELILLICSTVPMVLWLVIKYAFGFVRGNGFITALAFVLSGVFLLSCDRIKRREYPVKKTRLSDGVLIGVFRLMGFIPGLSGTAGVIFSSLLSGMKEKIIHKFCFIMCLPVLLGEIIISFPVALKIPMNIKDVIGCIVVLGAGFMATYKLSFVFYNILTKRKLKIFAYILFATAFISLLLWMRG